MGVTGSPNINQEKMLSLMAGLEFVRAYLNDLLVITKESFEDHLAKMEQVLKRLTQAKLCVNVTKSSFGVKELEYLSFWLIPEGVWPLTNKMEAIQRIELPKTMKQLRHFIGMVNNYRDMWQKRLHSLVPLTSLLNKDNKGNKKNKSIPVVWGEMQQQNI